MSCRHSFPKLFYGRMFRQSRQGILSTREFSCVYIYRIKKRSHGLSCARYRSKQSAHLAPVRFP
jgi:hypothetical protein